MEKRLQFAPTTEEMQRDMFRYVKRYGSKFGTSSYSNFMIHIALQDMQEDFWITRSFYLSDGIKHVDEPDENEFVIWKNGRCGLLRCWIRKPPFKKSAVCGDIPVSREALEQAACYFDENVYNWTRENGIPYLLQRETMQKWLEREGE